MRIPVIQGVIDRRILVNYRVRPEVLSRILPSPFQPKVVKGFGMAGICLIRLRQVRPRHLPGFIGVSSENAAHRIAVQWQANGKLNEGVFVIRRDSSSRFNTMVGGRIFPGIHHHAEFDVTETDDSFHIRLTSDDHKIRLNVDATLAEALPGTSVFESLAQASAFFEAGAVGYSPRLDNESFDGLELRSFGWKVEPLKVRQVESSYFSDTSLFPQDSIELDCALLMRGIEHEWHDCGRACAGVDGLLTHSA